MKRPNYYISYRPSAKTEMMRTKYSLFLLIGVYFLFSYPDIRTQWNLNQTIGWGWPKREVVTYFYPFWFLLLFLIYKAASVQKKEPSASFFWFHVLVSVLPTFFFNYPFHDPIARAAASESGFDSYMNRAHLMFTLYKGTQLVLLLILLQRVPFKSAASKAG